MSQEREPTKPKIVYLSAAETEEIGGVRRFDTELKKAFANIADLTIISALPGQKRLLRKVPVVGPSIAKFWAYRRVRRQVRRIEREQGADVIFHSFHWPPRVSKSAPTIGFVHDLRVIGCHDSRPMRWTNIKGQLVRWAISSWDVVCVPSSHVAADVTNLIPWLVPEVVGEGVDHLPLVDSGIRNRVLICAGESAHKRPLLAQELAVHVHDELRMPVTTIGLKAGSWSNTRDIVALKQVPDDEIARELSQALVMISTSSYEGFGLAVGEAMNAGCPVIIPLDSHLDFVVGDSGQVAEPSVSSFSSALLEILISHEDFSERAKKRAGRFTWAGCAQAILQHELGESRDESSEVFRWQGSDKAPEDGNPANPFWSVVIPTYNRCELLSRALDSVLAQSEEDFEVLVVDDASTDNTRSLIERYTDSRVKALYHPINRGAAEARNTGIRHSRGRYVAFLDSDDYWFPSKLEVVRKSISEHLGSVEQVGLASHASVVITDNGQQTGRFSSDQEVGIKQRLLRGDLIQTSSLAVAREHAIAVSFDSKLSPYEDWDFLMSLERRLHPNQVVLIGENLGVHDARNRSGRLSQSEGSRLAGLKFLRKYFWIWDRSERASFMVLRQLHTEKSLRPLPNLVCELKRQMRETSPRTVRHWIAATNCLLPSALRFMGRWKSRSRRIFNMLLKISPPGDPLSLGAHVPAKSEKSNVG